jgi:hypothetical protein
MDGHEAGRQNAEQFVMNVAKGLKQEGQVSALLWWTETGQEPGGAARAGDAPLALRIYKGNSWRAVEFAVSDIDGSMEKPELLTKYEAEITQSLMEL